MIDAILRPLVARIWRWRISRREQRRDQWTADFMQWKRQNPDRCMYCAYIRWVNAAQHLKMTLEPHYCVEGKSPPHPLPRAKVQ